jgi:hypothetical protein
MSAAHVVAHSAGPMAGRGTRGAERASAHHGRLAHAPQHVEQRDDGHRAGAPRRPVAGHARDGSRAREQREGLQGEPAQEWAGEPGGRDAADLVHEAEVTALLRAPAHDVCLVGLL